MDVSDEKEKALDVTNILTHNKKHEAATACISFDGVLPEKITLLTKK